MTRRRALWLLALAVVGLFVVELAYDRQMQDAGGHGIIAFEVAFTHARAHEILAAWGTRGHDAAVASLWFDFLFLIAYGLFLWLAVKALGDALARRGSPRLARWAPAVALLPLLAAACDALEDVFLLLQLGGRATQVGPPLAGGFATVKFASLAATLAYAIVALAALAAARRRDAPAR